MRSLFQFQQVLVKTDFSGHFSVALRPKSKDLGLAVELSETTLEGSGILDKYIEATEPKKRRPRGVCGLTAFAKRLLVGASNWLQQQYGKDRLVFHTATLPSDDLEIKLLCLRQSKEILKYWRKVLSRLLKSVGLPHEDIVIVMELQKRGAIHFHSLFVNDRLVMGGYKISLEKLDQAWRQAITAIVPQLKKADFSKSCRTERVKKSVGRYLAKYLSKAETKITQDIDFAITWYSVGNHLKKIVKDLSQQVTAMAVEFDFQALKELLATRRLAWQMSIFTHEKYGDRNLSGYYDYNQNFLQIIQPLLFRCGVLSFVNTT